MRIVLPSTVEQDIIIIPRTALNYSNSDFKDRVETDNGSVENDVCVSDVLATTNNISMVIKKDGEATEETLTDLTISKLTGNYKLSFASTILEEGHSYSIELTKDSVLFYRDKLYATSQTNFTIKHKQSQNNYTEVVDDNTYIV